VTSYVPGNASFGNFSTTALDVIELRVISNLLQREMSNASQGDELRILRNDQAFELGFVPPVVPGN
jgi:hypothetical protein